MSSISYYRRYLAWSAPFLTPYKTWGTSHVVRYFGNLLGKNLTKFESISQNVRIAADQANSIIITCHYTKIIAN